MGRQYIKVSSITYATKGRDILLNHGIRAHIERTHQPMEGDGCGYSIYVNGDADAAEKILRASGIKIIRRSEGRDI